jgi:hypothetical protein
VPEFKIGEAFPANNPVARFVIVLAMIYNDWRRTMEPMVASVEDADPDGLGIRLLHFRQAVGYSHEATLFLRDARRRPEIDTFVSGLGAEAPRHYDRMFVALRPVRKWVRHQRNAVFHYPSFIPRDDEPPDFDGRFAAALAAATDETSSATLRDTYREVRLDFADAVAVHRLGFKLPEQEGDLKALMGALVDAHDALKPFVVHAVDAYLNSLPPGVVRAES